MPSKYLSLLLTLAAALTCLGTSSRAIADEPAALVKVTQAENHLDVTIGGQPFTTYWFGPRDDRRYVRPFFWPVLASGQVPVTSDQYTLVNLQHVPKADHPHHQSLWIGSHESVNGVDHWSLGKDGKGDHSARQVHLKFDQVGGDGFVELLQWEGKDGKPMIDERRTVKFLAYGDGARAVDVTLALTALGGAVTFGDAKDAGMLAVRVAPGISKDPTITQSTGKGGEGMAGEKQTWGKPADWCDESGTIDGKPFGVAIFDAPSNPRHPEPWHVRAYGLMSPNPFGLSAFDKDKPKGAGELTIEPGKPLTFHYRAVFHAGNAADAKLAEKYKEFTGQ